VGSENLFHKRKARSEKQLARNKEKRSSYERVLIVCEGKKTEPNYFRELVNCLELNLANVEVDGKCDSSPSSVVKYAKKMYRQENKTGNGFDKVFCVFDKDMHSTYNSALIKIDKIIPKNVFSAANSVPCFEYWLLLHFEFTTKPFVANGAKSSCAKVIDNLKKHLPAYAKGDRYIC